MGLDRLTKKLLINGMTMLNRVIHINSGNDAGNKSDLSVTLVTEIAGIRDLPVNKTGAN